MKYTRRSLHSARQRRISLRSTFGFSIVEMIAVVAVIAILIGLLVPALSMVQKMAANVSQKAQFSSISMGLEGFREDMGDYPDSKFGDHYTGAQRLAEAMIGLDGFGFHPDSQWDGDLTVGAPYNYNDPKNIAARKGPYLELDTANAVKVDDIYASLGSFVASDTFVLVDKFKKVKHIITGKKVGMPILYFKANTLPLIPDYPASPASPVVGSYNNYAYSFEDNRMLLELGVPFDSAETHPMIGLVGGASIFYNATANPNFITPARPHNSESFILLSAGADGLYGTADDVYNFETDK